MDSSQGTTTPHAAVRGPAPSPKNERKVTRLQTVDSPNGLFVYPSPLYLFLVWLGLPAMHGLSLVSVSGATHLFQCAGFSLSWLLLLWL